MSLLVHDVGLTAQAGHTRHKYQYDERGPARHPLQLEAPDQRRPWECRLCQQQILARLAKTQLMVGIVDSLDGRTFPGCSAVNLTRAIHRGWMSRRRGVR